MKPSADRLLVEHERTRLGWLERAADARLSFVYDDEWLNARGSFPLSTSLPLREERFEGAEVAAFFRNLLPEGSARARIARALGISEQNDFELLRALGGDCAGALRIVSDGAIDAEEGGLVRLAPEEVDDLVRRPSSLGRILRREGVRLSLAGAQDKLPVVKTADGLFLPKGGRPSTHILKLKSPLFRALCENEALLMRTARAVGLPVVETELLGDAAARALLVTRYDRATHEGRVVRLHQEDLCQVFGLPPEQKYEEEGGPSFADVYRAVVGAVENPLADGETLLAWLVFNVIARNADGHAKNLSLLRLAPRRQALAPLYDLVCTGAYPDVHRRLAMRVGGESDPGQIRGASWDRLASDIGVGKRLVRGTVERFLDEVPRALDDALHTLTLQHGTIERGEQVRATVRRQAKRTGRLLREGWMTTARRSPSFVVAVSRNTRRLGRARDV